MNGQFWIFQHFFQIFFLQIWIPPVSQILTPVSHLLSPVSCLPSPFSVSHVKMLLKKLFKACHDIFLLVHPSWPVGEQAGGWQLFGQVLIQMKPFPSTGAITSCCQHSWAQRKLSPLSPLNILLTINGPLLFKDLTDLMINGCYSRKFNDLRF